MESRIEYISIQLKGRPPFICYSDDNTEVFTEDGQGEVIPGWALLKHHQCPNCPLALDNYKYCPLCTTLYPLFSYLSDVASTDETRITIKEALFSTQIKLTAQEAIPLILPQLTILSGCPHWRFNRWAYRYFSYSSDYKFWVFKALAIALVRELVAGGKFPEKEEIIEKVRHRLAGLKVTVESLRKRITGEMEDDAGLNALVSGSSLVSLLEISVDECLAEWEKEILAGM
ncbi:MAG: hypothetical protein GXP53_03935 [Deltaproteobacteria bacterium]|nr:hypothetical protein [Deltaproteobacteria bacterium]